MKYAGILSAYIDQSGMTLEQISAKCAELEVKIHPSYISKLRKATRPVPSEEITVALATAMGKTPNELLTAGRLEKTPASIVEAHEEFEELSKLFAPTIRHLLNDSYLLQRLFHAQQRYATPTELSAALGAMSIGDKLKFLTTHGIELKIAEDLDGSATVSIDYAAQAPPPMPPPLAPTSVPILGRIRCGVPLLDETNWDEQIQLPESLHADFAARADGDSMLYAGIHAGDIILFRENVEPYNGQIVATRHIQVAEGVNLKYFINKNGHPLLRSGNPDYKDILLNEDHQIIGVMVGLIREDPPSLSDYETLLTLKSDADDRWTETISLAAAYGIKPEDIQSMIRLQIQMAQQLSRKN